MVLARPSFGGFHVPISIREALENLGGRVDVRLGTPAVAAIAGGDSYPGDLHDLAGEGT